MEFRKPGPEQSILERRENAVADELVERHSTLEGIGPWDHARAEDNISFADAQWFNEGWQHFRSILSVAVQKRDEVEAFYDRIMEADLLIAPISLIDRIVQDREPE